MKSSSCCAQVSLFPRPCTRRPWKYAFLGAVSQWQCLQIHGCNSTCSSIQSHVITIKIKARAVVESLLATAVSPTVWMSLTLQNAKLDPWTLRNYRVTMRHYPNPKFISIRICFDVWWSLLWASHSCDAVLGRFCRVVTDVVTCSAKSRWVARCVSCWLCLRCSASGGFPLLSLDRARLNPAVSPWISRCQTAQTHVYHISQRWNSHSAQLRTAAHSCAQLRTCFFAPSELGALLCSFFHHIVGANDLQRLGCHWELRNPTRHVAA